MKKPTIAIFFCCLVITILSCVFGNKKDPKTKERATGLTTLLFVMSFFAGACTVIGPMWYEGLPT